MSVLGQVWLQAYCSFINSGSAKTLGDATTLADYVVEEYKKRFCQPAGKEPFCIR